MAEPSRDFGYWLAIFANLAVVGGIIFLGIEIRQNSQMMRAQTRNEISRSVIEHVNSENEPGLMEALQRNWQGGEVDQDQYYLMGYSRTLLRLWENMYYQYRSGLFDEEEFEAEMVAWERITQQPFLIDFWNLFREEFSEEFRTVIDSLVAGHQ